MTRPVEKPDTGRGFLVREHFEVGDTAGVIDTDMHGLPTSAVGVVAGVASPGDAMAGFVETIKLLDVDVDYLAKMSPAIPVRRLKRLQFGEPVQTNPSLVRTPPPQPNNVPRTQQLGVLGQDVGGALSG